MRNLLIVISLFLLVSACSRPPQQGGGAKIAATDTDCTPVPVRHLQLEKEAKRIAEEVDGVDQAVVVWIDDEMDVALEVNNFDRLRLKQLRKEVFNRLRNAYPTPKIHVTTDSKLFDELDKLSRKKWVQQKKDACQAKKQLKQIEEQMKG